MPTTPTYALRYQGLADPPHGPNLGQNLAEDVEAQIARLDGLIAAVPKLIAWQRRTTSTTPAATTTGVIRLNIPVVLGNMYRISTNHVGVDSSVSADGIRIQFHYTTNGVNATTSDTTLDMSQLTQTNQAHGEYLNIDHIYVPATTHTLSIMLSVARSLGTGLVGVTAGTGLPGPCWLAAWDLGPALAQSGVNI